MEEAKVEEEKEVYRNYSLMKVTIIYDNTVFNKNLQGDWGFSALIEAEDAPRILFDTGANGEILLLNMKKLGINPVSIEEVFISHAHFDHVGGLSEFLNTNEKVKIYIPPSFRGMRKKEVVTISKPTKIHNNVFSTGEIEGIEQSLGVITGKGIVLIVGCSHPYMGNILDVARKFGKIYGIIGGLHGFSDFKLFKDLKLVCPTHCTQYKEQIKELYPKQCIEGGAGKIIDIN